MNGADYAFIFAAFGQCLALATGEVHPVTNGVALVCIGVALVCIGVAMILFWR